jgi:hypothetical protein
MTEERLGVVRFSSEKITLREQVEQALLVEKNRIKDRVQKWLLYMADLGATKLYLDECPGIGGSNLKQLGDWLLSEGFRVDIPRFGRVAVWLEE